EQSFIAGWDLPRCNYTGNSKQNIAPWPISLSTQILPPCASMKSLEMAKPKPVPFDLEPGTWKYRSNKRFWYSLAIPGPLSFTEKMIEPFLRSMLMSILLSVGEYLMALVRK